MPLRKGLKELGGRLAAIGVVKDPMDVFFAHFKELDKAIVEDAASQWDILSESIKKEKAEYLKDKERSPDWILGESKTGEEEGDHLTGLPGSSGKASGAVYIVLSTDDFAKFPKDAVLVTRTTNPAWTPLFYSASAIITESGGPLSHGAVTARKCRNRLLCLLREY